MRRLSVPVSKVKRQGVRRFSEFVTNLGDLIDQELDPGAFFFHIFCDTSGTCS